MRFQDTPYNERMRLARDLGAPLDHPDHPHRQFDDHLGTIIDMLSLAVGSGPTREVQYTLVRYAVALIKLSVTKMASEVDEASQISPSDLEGAINHLQEMLYNSQRGWDSDRYLEHRYGIGRIGTFGKDFDFKKGPW